jgi:hypothetical protein
VPAKLSIPALLFVAQFRLRQQRQLRRELLWFPPEVLRLDKEQSFQVDQSHIAKQWQKLSLLQGKLSFSEVWESVEVTE